MRADIEHLRRAAEYILMAIASSDGEEQEAMLNIAHSWLQQSEVIRNAEWERNRVRLPPAPHLGRRTPVRAPVLRLVASVECKV
jgi:hypothetical protein